LKLPAGNEGSQQYPRGISILYTKSFLDLIIKVIIIVENPATEDHPQRQATLKALAAEKQEMSGWAPSRIDGPSGFSAVA
jgi:hypothetical protein